MNLTDIFAKVVSKKPLDTSVAAARLNRLIGQNRVLPPRNAKIQGDSAFWKCVKDNNGTLLTQSQYQHISSLRPIINGAFRNGTKVSLVLDKSQRNVREIYFVATGEGNMKSLNLKSFSLIWNATTMQFEQD